MLVRLQRWVPANQPLAEHWSMSTSCRLTSTRTTPLQEREQQEGEKCQVVAEDDGDKDHKRQQLSEGGNLKLG